MTEITRSNQFAFDLYDHLIGNINGDIVISPVFLKAVLIPVYAGLRGYGRKEMSEILNIGEKNHIDIIDEFRLFEKNLQWEINSGLNVFEGIWIQESKERLAKTYYDILRKFPEIHFVNFRNNWGEIEVEINRAVKIATNDGIKDIILAREISASTKITVINANYFKGLWEKSFDRDLTEMEEWKMGSHYHSKAIYMMHGVGSYGYFEDKKIRAIKIPYMSQRLSMLILSPVGGNYSDFEFMERNLKEHDFDKIIRKTKTRELQLAMPKFAINCRRNLQSVLRAMGVKDATSPYKANFSGIANGNLYLSDIIQSCRILINEEGNKNTESQEIKNKKLLEIKLNRPFIFFIVHNPSKTIIFMGRVIWPEWK